MASKVMFDHMKRLSKQMKNTRFKNVKLDPNPFMPNDGALWFEFEDLRFILSMGANDFILEFRSGRERVLNTSKSFRTAINKSLDKANLRRRYKTMPSLKTITKDCKDFVRKYKQGTYDYSE